MNIFSSFTCVYHIGLNESVGFVFTLLCTQIFAVTSTSENVNFQKVQFKSTDQFDSKANSQIPISSHKCCARDEWLRHLSLDKKTQCIRLPSNIENMSLQSNYNRQFSKSGILSKPRCITNRTIEMWTRSNARDYQYYLENETVLNLVTQTYFKVLCGDYVDLDNFYSKSVNYDNVENFRNLENNSIGFVLCDIWEHTFPEKISIFLATYGVGVSNFFLAVTFYLYLTTSELRRKIHGKCILCYIASLIFGFTSYIWNVCVFLYVNAESTIYCSLTAFLCQYGLLSMFTWLTLICINLSSAVAVPTPEHSGSRKFMVYCLIGWGFPLAMSVATFIASRLDRGDYLMVDFDLGCWFYTEKDRPYWLQPEFIYFNSYVLLTLFINLSLFIRTTFILISSDCYWKKLNDSQRHEANENRFLRYLKLFLVMGSTWSVGSISFNTYFTNIVGRWFGIVLDFLTMSQGIIIFIVFVCMNRNEELKMKLFNRKQKQSSTISMQGSEKENIFDNCL